MYFTSVNPFTNKPIRKIRKDSKINIAEKITLAKSSQNTWAQLTIKARGKHLSKLSQSLLKNKQELARLASEEMGKPYLQGLAEIEKSAKSLNYYVENAEAFLKNIPVKTEATSSYISFQPLGVVLAIMPWNFPYWQVYRAMGPILMSGNTMLLKHASNVMGCASAMQQLAEEAGLPEGVFQILKVEGKDMENIIAHDNINAITFTGSSEAGANVAAIAAKHLKKQVLELGGSDAYLILEDADLDLAVEKCTQSRLNNTGQSCIAAKRFVVLKTVEKEFIQKLKASFEAKRYGDPLEEDNDMGPLARQDLRDQLHLQVLASVKKGAKVVTGGFIPKSENALYPPTILCDVKKGMPAFDEEMFGPVASVIKVKDIDEAVAIANDSIYGLGGGIFSKNIKLATDIAQNKIEAGFVSVNDYVSSDPRLPFGGIKQSGYGRELAHFGIQEFCNIKTVYVK